MEIDAGQSRNRPARIMFNVSDSSLEDISTSTNENTPIKRFNFEFKKNRSDIIYELANINKEINLAIWIIYALYSFTWFLIGVQWLGELTWGLEIDCNILDLKKAKWSFYEKRNLSNPPNSIYDPGCVYYDYQYYHLAYLTFEEAYEIVQDNPRKPAILKCKNVLIKTDVPKEVTHIREFQVFCLKRSLYNPKLYLHIGVMIFGFPMGLLSDIYGRRPVNKFCSVLLCLSAFVVSFSPNFVIFALGMSFLGGALYSVNMLLDSEVFRNKYRGFNTLLAFGWFYVGCASPDSNYKLIEVWRLRKLIIAILILIIVFGAIMTTPESPRLLAIKKQFKTAWDCLHELGSSTKSDAQNYFVPKINMKYQLKIFTKSYLLHRIYSVLILNGVATFFYYMFRNMKRTVLRKNVLLSLEMLFVQIVLVLFTGLLMFFYSRKTLICMFYVLLSFSILTNMLAYSDIIADVGALAGQEFSAILFILTIIYLMEVFPTSHRGTSMGLYTTADHLLQALSQAYIDEIMSRDTTEIFSAFYCGICMLCALITVMIPDSDDDIPDRKEDLFLPLSTATSNLYDNTSDL